jgi:DNA-binding MarR family transcriptional regulator
MKNSISTAALLSHVAITQKMLRKADTRLSVHGISFTEYLIMYHLENAHNKTMRRIDLAEAVGLSASGVTRLIAPMEKNYLVEKRANPRDARVSLVRLSKTGLTVFEDSSRTIAFLAEEVFANFKRQDLKSLAELEAKVAI